MKSVSQVTIYDITAEDCGVIITKNLGYGFMLRIDDENCNQIVDECISPEAASQMAEFCRRYLRSYDNATKLGAA